LHDPITNVTPLYSFDTHILQAHLVYKTTMFLCYQACQSQYTKAINGSDCPVNISMSMIKIYKNIYIRYIWDQ